jgi:hypothetical protein
LLFADDVANERTNEATGTRPPNIAKRDSILITNQPVNSLKQIQDYLCWNTKVKRNKNGALIDF